MKRSSIIPIIIFSLIGFWGCMSMERKQQWFVDEMNHDVGRPFMDIPVPKPSKITEINGGKSEYLVQFGKTGCQVIYIVDDVTQKVVSWRYDSEPEKCYLELDWSGPW